MRFELLIGILLSVCSVVSEPVSVGGSKQKLKLQPLSHIFPIGIPSDTTLGDGSFLKYEVNTDTTDRNLYIDYGTKKFSKLYTYEQGLLYPMCAVPVYAYSTKRVFALISECTNTGSLLILPLQASAKPITYEPLFVSVRDSVLLVQVYDTKKRQNKIVVADLDTRQKQDITLHHEIPCRELMQCFDTIYYRKGYLNLKYVTNESRTGKSSVDEKIRIAWK